MTVQLDAALADLKQEFAPEFASGAITHVGTFNCRRKNNKPDGPWSEHAWPNAADVHVTTGGKPAAGSAKLLGERIAAYMRAHPELWSEVFWQIDAHFDHVHGTATPRRNFDNKQVPPCAGGPNPGDDDMTPEQAQQLADIHEVIGIARVTIGTVENVAVLKHTQSNLSHYLRRVLPATTAALVDIKVDPEDVQSLAAAIANSLDDELAQAVADELAKRLVS